MAAISTFEIKLTTDQWACLVRFARAGTLAADMDIDGFEASEEELDLAHETMALVHEHLVSCILGNEPKTPRRVEPSAFDWRRAHTEGWTCDLNEALGRWEISSADGDLGSEWTDWVRTMAGLGHAYHQAALDWIEAANALEEASRNTPVRKLVRVSG
jgi:hypothetical protein